LGEVKEGLALDIKALDETVTAFYGTDLALNRKLNDARRKCVTWNRFALAGQMIFAAFFSFSR